MLSWHVQYVPPSLLSPLPPFLPFHVSVVKTSEEEKTKPIPFHWGAGFLT